MNRLVVCMGNYAKIPYRINDIKTDVYCIEEFCYYLREYTNLLDEDLLDRQLIDWIREQCGLKELASMLQSVLDGNGEVSLFVGTLLRYVNFAKEEQIREIERVLRQNDGLSPLERKKQRADNLIREKKYYFGLDLYHELIKEIPESQEQLLARVLYNCGVAYANLFYFEIALEMFEKAYGISGDDGMKQACLYCRRNLLSKQEYLQYVAEHQSCYEDSLKLEQELRALKERWNADAKMPECKVAFLEKEKYDAEACRKQLDEKLDEWQKEYMTMVRIK